MARRATGRRTWTRFRTIRNARLFLISLKAGGLGLNLTAAEYVFLLDPWWNPAVEAQAVDRAHRIGQTRPVFAYRLIARDTVEEKVLELHGGAASMFSGTAHSSGSRRRKSARPQGAPCQAEGSRRSRDRSQRLLQRTRLARGGQP